MRVCPLSILIAGFSLLNAAGCKDSEPVRHERAVTESETSEAKGVKIVVWRSVQKHTPGALGIEIGPAAPGQVMSEPRTGGVTEVEVEFSAPVTLADAKAAGARHADVSVTPAQVALAKPTVLVMKFDALREGQCYLLSIAGAIADLSGQAECRVRCLEGDVNNDGRVDNADAQAIKQKAGQAVAADTARFDVDRQGSQITLTDVLRVRTLDGHAADCR